VLSAFGYVLSRASGDDDICIGSAFANRSWAGASEIIGMMINTVVLRYREQPGELVHDLLARSSDLCNRAQAHQAFPFERLVQVLNPPREPGVNPLFQVFLGFHDSPLPELRMPGVNAISLKEAVDSRSAKFDLSLVVIPRTGQEGEEDPVHMLWEFKRSRFAPWFITSLIDAFDRTVNAFLDAPYAPLHTMQIVPPQLPRPRVAAATSTVVGRILARADARPDAVAIEFDGRTLRYAELAASIRKKSAVLRAHGTDQGDVIGVCLERSPELVAWLLAVQWVGAAYVPLDPEYPVDRLRYIVDHCRPHRVVVGELCHDIVDANRRLAPDADSESRQSIFAPPDPTAPAYIIYTSGSTGRPKGVVIGHDNLSSFIDAMAALFPLQTKSCWVAVTSCSFDISILELFLPLTLGARLVLANEADARDAARLAKLLMRSGADHLQATPSTWRALIETEWTPPRGFVSLCGGEAMDGALARQCLARGMRLYNLYGPTETTIWSCVHGVSDADDPVPIGMPLGNTETFVLDRHRRPVLQGTIGELWIGGEGVARGYLRAPEQTAERFLAHPFGGEGRVYATGDLASTDTHGRLHFHGRNDHQVKIRGFRIELAEIEECIREIDGIAETVVVAHGREMDAALIAYVVTSGETLSPAALTLHCARLLPSYMVPSHWVVLSALPLSPNGKIDRAALPKFTSTGKTSSRPPSSASERAVAAIYADLLGTGINGVSDGFIASGGHSLLAMRAVARLNRDFGVGMSVVDFLRLSTIEAVAERIDLVIYSRMSSHYVEEIIL
jgi:amino acid adenylation domain-containing protein